MHYFTYKMTIEQLAEMIQNTIASKEDVKDIVGELNTTHADVYYIRSTVDALVHSDIVHDAAIEDLTARLDQKAGRVK